MNGHERMLETAAAYALGTLGTDEAARFAQHLRSCPECQTECAFLHPAVDALGVSAEAQPSDFLKARIMKAIRPTTNVPAQKKARSIVWPAYLVAAACIVLALLTAVSNLRLGTELARVRGRAAETEQRVAYQSRSLAAQRLMMADLMATDAKRYRVTGGQVVRRGDRLYLAMNSMAPLSKGHVYQAWTLPRGSKTMSPSITFSPDNSGVAVISLPERGSALAAVAVSVEPEGGSKAPTSKPQFVQVLS
ncbi:MAG: anti-sigma factor [Candidatus Eremiobacteraeota bacterium]|nr:anti-sigma factor [Candidatus Eremiobacteraeota bacterium]